MEDGSGWYAEEKEDLERMGGGDREGEEQGEEDCEEAKEEA